MRRRLTLVASVVIVPIVLAAVTLPMWKPAAKRFKWFVVATNVYQDTLRRTGIRRDQISQPDFASMPDAELPRYLTRIDSTFNDYQKYGPLTAEAVRDKRILEVGPGETLGVALRFVGMGARQVVAVDKFVPLQTSSFHQRLYRALADRLPAQERERVLDAVALDNGVRFNENRLKFIGGQGVEEATPAIASGGFDLVVSNAVLEEVYDLDHLLATFDSLLKPGGRQIHNIDLRDYGMFSKHGFHPLEFLTLPDTVYRYMVEASGQPNRRLVDSYRKSMDALGYRAAVFCTWVIGGGTRLPEYRTQLQYGRDYSDDQLQLVRSIRPRLLPRYRNLPDEDLLTASILLVAEKPSLAAANGAPRMTK
jgi:SAM-dependent methyltransferase